MEYFGYFASILIGLILGLIGGGGSILTIPVLVYLFKIEPQNATTYSLFVVGISAFVGSYQHYKAGNLRIKSALAFAIPSIASLLLVRKILLPLIPENLGSIAHFLVTKNLLIMIVFSVLMIASSVMMIRKNNSVKTSTVNYTKLSFIGFGIGLIIGFLGAGGGFLIIPALLFFANLEMKQAVGTSLLIIFINSTIGFLSDITGNVSINYTLLFTISGLAIVGMIIGTFLSKKIEGNKLKPAFGWFVLVIGVYIIFKEFSMNL